MALFYRKIVSESSAMVNGMDMNGSNQQQDELNDITDGQPFGPPHQLDWNATGPTTVWPETLSDEGTAEKKHNGGDASVSTDAKDSGLPYSGPESSAGAGEGEKLATGASCEIDDTDTSTVADTNNSNSATVTDGGLSEENAVVSDFVKLPPSSSLFSRIASSEFRLDKAETDSSEDVSGADIKDTNGDNDELNLSNGDKQSPKNDSSSIETETEENEKHSEEPDVENTSTSSCTTETEEGLKRDKPSEDDEAIKEEEPPEKKVTFHFSMIN